jgi:hypothetical protein
MVGSCRCHHHHHHLCNNWPRHHRPARMFRFRVWIVRNSETLAREPEAEREEKSPSCRREGRSAAWISFGSVACHVRYTARLQNDVRESTVIRFKWTFLNLEMVMSIGSGREARSIDQSIFQRKISISCFKFSSYHDQPNRDLDKTLPTRSSSYRLHREFLDSVR